MSGVVTDEMAERILKRVLAAAQKSPTLSKKATRPWAVSVSLVTGPVMARLNLKFKGKAYPTDVLSFPAPEVFRDQGRLGEIIICLPTLERQAMQHDHPPRAELEVLLVHGVLHLLGFDHEKGGAAAREMAKWEKKLLGKLNGLIARAK